MDMEKYLDCLRDMLNLAPGHTTVTLRNYLAPLEKQFGDKFDPIVALNDLIKSAQILQREIIKAKRK